jgi:hypothetical protein
MRMPIIARATTPTTTPMMMLRVLSPMLSLELTDAAVPKSEAAGLVLTVALCVLLDSLDWLVPVALAAVPVWVV